MDRVYTEGPTWTWCKAQSDPDKNYGPSKYCISILSRRACYHVLRRSFEGTWLKPVSRIVPEIDTGYFIIAGFQPDTGAHICYKVRR